MGRFLCWWRGHEWPGRGFEVCDVWETYGIWYLTASQRCQRWHGSEQCPATNTVRVLTHKECPR